MTRDDRQKLSCQRWVKAGGAGTLVCCTGFGKSRCAIMIIQSLYKRNPQLNVLIAVPTDVLKEQWHRELAKNKLFSVCKVEIVNSIIKNTYNVDLLVIDEVHQFFSEKNLTIFEVVKYRYVLGLTATFERLDGRHELATPYIPICDVVTLKDALANGWVSNYRKYKVLIKVDMTQYQEYNAKFQQIFSFFGHDFKLVMELINSKKKVKVWAKRNGKEENIVRGYLAQFMRYLRLRKSFVMSHPKKFEIANKILDYRRNKKCILFTSTVKDAEKFKTRSLILHSQKKKKENKAILEHFNTLSIGNITSPKALDAGVDVKGLSVGIALTCNSSQITDTQRVGRVCRFEEGKIAEFFTLVIAGSVEEQWYSNANKNQSYITINEDQLDIILNGGEVSTRPKQGIVDLENRF